jgi:hypothetical protein
MQEEGKKNSPLKNNHRLLGARRDCLWCEDAQKVRKPRGPEAWMRDWPWREGEGQR